MIEALNTLVNEKEIIQKIIAGELALFEVLIRRYNSVLYKIAKSYGFNHQDAEDLMQEVHFSVYKSLPKFEFRSSYKTWISKIMIHQCQYKKAMVISKMKCLIVFKSTKVFNPCLLPQKNRKRSSE